MPVKRHGVSNAVHSLIVVHHIIYSNIMSRYNNICIIMVDVTEKHGNRLALMFISIRVSSLARFLPRSSGRAVNQTRRHRI